MDCSREPKLRKLMDRLRDKARRKVPEADVEDIVQEVLVVLVERMKRGQVDALQAYAEGILRHMVYDYYQSKHERMVSLEHTAETETKSPSPEEHVTWMRHLRVIDGLAQENPVDRALVDEHFVKGSPLREVATQLKVSPGVVNGRLFRFRQKVIQRVGSCFAMLAAIMVGTWSRITRALVAVRVYGSVVGMFSIGTFATWMWWPQAQQPTTPPKATPTTSTSTYNTNVHSNVIAAPIEAPTIPLYSVSYDVFPTQIAPEDTIQITPVLLPGKWAPSTISPTQEAPPTQAPAAKHAAFAPQAETMQTRPPSMAHGYTSSAGTTLAGTNAAIRLAAFSQTNAGQSNASASTGNATNQASAQAPGTNNTQQNTPTNPTPGKTAPPSRTAPTQPGTTQPPITGGPNPALPKTPPRSLQPSLQQPGNGAANIRAEEQINRTDSSNTGYLPNDIVMPSRASSFCVVQDGRIYQCGGTKMTDITGAPNSTFVCGTNKLCTQIIGAGPSLLFTNTGDLYLLGHHIYRKSEDGGHSWHTPATLESSDVLLKAAQFVLQSNGALWQQQQSQWTQARHQQTSVHEVRVQVSKGQLHFEDDTGFQLNSLWKTNIERRVQAPAPVVPQGQTQQATPTIKIDGGQPFPKDAPAAQEEDLPISQLP